MAKYESYKGDVNEAKKYAENANNDIAGISGAQNDAIRKANSAVGEFNSHVKTVTVSSSRH